MPEENLKSIESENSKSDNINSAGEIKFKVKTLQSDLEGQEGKESRLNIEYEKPPTQKIEYEQPAVPLPEDTLVSAGKLLNLDSQKMDIGKEALSELEASGAMLPSEKIQFDRPQIFNEIQQSEKTPVIKFEKDASAQSFFEKIKLIYIIPAVIVIIAGISFWVYQTQKAKQNAKKQLPTAVQAIPQEPQGTPEQPAIAPATSPIIGQPTSSLIQTTATQTQSITIINHATTTKKIAEAPAINQTPTATSSTNLAKGTPTQQSDEQTTIEEPKSPKIYEPMTGTQKEMEPIKTGATTWIIDLPIINVSVNEINSDSFKLAWKESLRYQKKAGELWLINFSSASQRIPAEFIIDYFFNPTFIEKKFSNNFKNSIGPNYEIVYYYTHTRKFPMLIMEINNDLTAVPFLKLWDKENMISDLKNIYYAASTAKFTRNYMETKSFKEIDYRIAYKTDDYKFLWLVYNNKLIISSSISGFQILIDKLQLLE